MIRSGKPIYYCRVCHALIDNAIRRIAHQNGIDLILGGYTKGQQYIRNSELFWIYKESDENAVELFRTMSGYEDYADLIHNQNKYFREHYGNMRLLSPFKYIEWNEDKILDIHHPGIEVPAAQAELGRISPPTAPSTTWPST